MTGARGARRALVVPLIGAALVVGALASSSHARRLPAPGGRISLSLPPELIGPTTDAHLYAPFVEPSATTDAGRMLAQPPLPGFPAWRSAVIKKLDVEQGGRVWRIAPAAPVRLVVDALQRCLAAAPGERSWPADVLRATGTTVDVVASGPNALVRFSTPVGPAPELLAGCLLRAAQTPPNGPYVLVTPTLLRWQPQPFDVPPLVSFLELRPTGESSDLAASAADVSGAGTVLAPFPDVVLLLQSQEARRSDPLGLKDPAAGTRGFKAALRADLLLAAYGAGRGTAVDAILPPGIAPARPLPEPHGAERAGPLALAHLPPGAPRVVVRKADGDPLVDGVAERLAVLLRARGAAMDARRTTTEKLEQGVEVLRWRPPTTDPALALLALAGRRHELVDDAAVQKALKDARLLSADAEARLAAALAVERALLDAGVVVPLMTADLWFTIDPDLRGVAIRPDGVPLLDDAYWGGR